MIAKLIQEQVSLDSRVKFVLMGDGEISGKLVEIGRTHIKIEVKENQAPVVIPIDRVSYWQLLTDTPQSESHGKNSKTISESNVSKNDNSQDSPDSDSTAESQHDTNQGDEVVLELGTSEQANNQFPSPDVPQSQSDKNQDKDDCDESETKQLPEVNQSEDQRESALLNTEIEIVKKLVEIETRFQTKLQNARIEVKEPDFKFPQELNGFQKTNVNAIWTRIQNKYNNAKKIRELSAKFGRIQPILSELQSLMNQFRSSVSIKRHFAYLCTLSGDQQDAIKYYQEIALSSQSDTDWYNLAVVAQETANEELACYSLSQVFHQLPATNELEAWYLYICLLLKFNNHTELGMTCQTEQREISQDEGSLLLETVVYLLKVAEQEDTAKEVLRKSMTNDVSVTYLQEILNVVDLQPTEGYQRVAEEIASLMKVREEKKDVEAPPQGHIYAYKLREGYGFLRDCEGTEYFFHLSAIIDPVLREEVTDFTGKPIPIAFQGTQGSKGLMATQISGHKTIHDWYNLAESAADTGDYAKAIAHIKEVLSIDKTYLDAQAAYDTWREYARASGVPKGSNPFARAKRAQLLEKDLDKASELFRQAIAEGDNLESAVNDLAWLLTQLNQFEEAVTVIEQNRFRISNRQGLENVLTNIYKKFGVHDKAIELLQKQLSLARTSEKKDMIRWQIASSYLKLNDYAKAEDLFRMILKQQPDNVSVKRNIAFCLSKQERYQEAEELLNQILIVSSDQKTAELFEAVSQAKQTGEKDLFDGIVIEAELSDYSSGQVSSFTQFFLDRCDFQGVPAERIQTETFYPEDITFLEGQATKSRTTRPSDRASYYLSAAKIISILEDEDRNRFYRFLCRSFASKGDDAVINNGNLDAAREWYAEALSVYDGDRVPRKDEQDAVNALVRFLHSRLGRSHIPMPPRTPSINDTIDEVIEFAESKRLFDDITYLVFRSKYAANRLLTRLYDQQNLRDMALLYLKTENIHIPNFDLSKQKFISLWNQLRDRRAEEVRKINRDLRLLSKCQLTTAWLETAVRQTQSIVPRLRLPLDQDRIRQLQESLERAIEMCKQVRFEAQKQLWDQIDSSCRDLLTDIVNRPTRISAEVLYPVIENIQTKVDEYLEELYVTSKPDLTLSMPVEDYSGHDSNIEVEIAVENKLGCSSAEGLELIIKEDHKSFKLTQPEIKLEESLLGGTSHNFTLPLRLTDQALRSETFSLSVYARYRTQTEEPAETPFEDFTIRLYPKEAFKTIENPYNEGPVVSDPEMFYGRDRLIENIADSIQKSDVQSKCVIIYGQKRSGKSSVLYHLKEKLLEVQNIVILDLGNIGEYLDPHSRVPFSHQILRLILRSLEEAIEDRIDAGSDSLEISFPNEREFYENPTPMILFKETFNKYLHLASKQSGWRDVQLVLLIDEFSYIYGQILAGYLSGLFMKNWKALMQANYFNAVLVGQDVMERFLETYQNEFGIAQKERVTYLDREDAVDLIDEPICIDGHQAESRYREQRAIERIMELTAGSPFYIQMICNRLVEHINYKRAKYVTYSYVEHVKNQLISGRNALGLGSFENLYNSGEDNDSKDQDVLKILKIIATKSQTGLCNRSHIDCKTELSIDELLDELVERDVINREKEHYYSIKVGLFKEWLLVNHKGEI